MKIDWSDPKCKLSPNFLVSEACFLPSWDRMHVPTLEEQSNILRTIVLMEKVREILDQRPIKVHCLIRPEKYNIEIGGARESAHIRGLACDFSVAGLTCDRVRERLLPHLVRLNCRMEDRPKSDWVHVDLAPVKISRFFKP